MMKSKSPKSISDYCDTYVMLQNLHKLSFFAPRLPKSQKGTVQACYAGVIKPLVETMIAIYPLEPSIVAIYDTMTDLKHPLYPTCPEIVGDRHVLVIHNSSEILSRTFLHSDSNAQSDWHYFGRLGLMSVVLEFGEDELGLPVAQIGLALEPTYRTQEHSQIAFNLINFDLQGRVSLHSISLDVHRHDFLLHTLGVSKLEKVAEVSAVEMGDFEEAIGFPGAMEYIASALPRLVDYFAESALALRKQ